MLLDARYSAVLGKDLLIDVIALLCLHCDLALPLQLLPLLLLLLLLVLLCY